jgi:ankyrin repeat protein
MSGNLLHELVRSADGSEHHLNLLKSVLSLGVNVNLQDSNGDTPLHIAAKQRNADVLQVLFACRPDQTIVNHQGLTAEQCFVAAFGLPPTTTTPTTTS